jgi:hypothetical protein
MSEDRTNAHDCRVVVQVEDLVTGEVKELRINKAQQFVVEALPVSAERPIMVGPKVVGMADAVQAIALTITAKAIVVNDLAFEVVHIKDGRDV